MRLEIKFQSLSDGFCPRRKREKSHLKIVYSVVLVSSAVAHDEKYWWIEQQAHLQYRMEKAMSE